MNWNVFSTKDELENQLTEEVSRILVEGIKNKGFATLLISGGSTPKGFFEKLSRQKLPWEAVKISLIDDRLDKKYSNENMVNDLLLQNEASKAEFISLLADEKSPTKDVNNISQRTSVFIQNMDCVILGMGLDGHTASLFPGDPDSEQAMMMKLSEGHIAYTNAPNEPVERITFSLEAISLAKHVFLHVYGQGKKQILTRTENNLPITKTIKKIDSRVQIFYTD